MMSKDSVSDGLQIQVISTEIILFGLSLKVTSMKLTLGSILGGAEIVENYRS